jgi:hypothetical protein
VKRKHSRGNGDGAFLKVLFYLIGGFTLGAVALGWLAPANAPTSAPGPPPPPPAAVEPPGLDLCTNGQLSGKQLQERGQIRYSGKMAQPPEPSETDDTSEPNELRDRWDWLAGAICTVSLHRNCDVTWQSRVTYLCTDEGRPIEALEYVEGSIAIEDFITGPRYTNEMKLCKGSECSPFDIVNPRFNCHGDSFAYAEYWIQDPEVQRILDDDYDEIAQPDPGDIVIYRESKKDPGVTRELHCANQETAGTGVIVHSARWVGPRSLDMTFGKRGFEPRKRYMPVGPGPDAAWDNADACVSYYRKQAT